MHKTDESVRFDAARFSKTTINNDGFLETDAIVTRTGIFSYRNSDGSTRRELRHPDDVFTQKSLESMKMIPITDGHPDGRLVNSKSAKSLQVGQVGETIKVDGTVIRSPIVITDESAIAKVKSGKNQLSLGYSATVTAESGEYNGQRYDSRQTNIRYNHLAICNLARAGAAAAIVLDEGDAIQIEDDKESKIKNDIKSKDINNNKKTRGKKMVKINIDSIAYEASPEVSNAYNKQLTRIDEMQKELDTNKGKFDQLQSTKDELQKKNDTFEKTLNDTVAAAVKERVALVESAKGILAKETKLDEMTDNEIKKAVILNFSKEAKLDEKTDEYINARFDGALDMKEARKDVSGQRKTVVDATKGGTTVSILDEAKQNYRNRLNRVKKEETK